MKILRNILSLTLLWLLGLTAAAQRIQVSAPPRVATGEQFYIAYTVNTQDIKNPQLGAIPAGLRLLGGPFVSQQSSYQIINGHASSSSTVQFVYAFEATRHGTVSAPAFHVTAGGRRVNAQTVRLSIVGQDQVDEPATPQPQPQPQPSQPAPSHEGKTAKSSDDDLFITVTASKKSCLEQEALLLTYKVYTTQNLTQLNGKMPDVKGAHTQEVQLPQQKSLQPDTYNGRQCRSTVWTQYLVYPQISGKLHIPAIKFEGTVVKDYNDLMGLGQYEEEHCSITAPAIDIDVKALPTKPATYGGGVGQFNLSAQPGSTNVKAGDPFTLRIVVGGKGNLKLLQQPTVKYPDGFDVYDTKTTDKTNITADGVEGNIIFDYTAVPRKEGKFTIPAVEWTYYDTSSHQYKTLRTQPITLNVAKGDGNGGDAADYTQNQKLDIRPITTDEATVRSLSDAFFASGFYWGVLAILLGIFVALLLRFHQRALERADIVHMLSKNAGKTAEKRLRKARQLMVKGRADRFYDEVLKALWGYAANRLNMRREQLSRDNIAEKLSRRGVGDEPINNFISAIDECEFERYAPGDAAGNMKRTLEAALSAITRLQEALTEARKHSRAERSGYAMTLLLLLLPLTSSALTKQNGDAEYAKGNYQQAITDYQAVLKTQGASTEVYYNLGNAYYRADNIPQAILAYERALQLSPGNSDARFNLELARTKTIDKVVPTPELFIITWYKAVVNLASADQWGIVSIVSLALAIGLVLLFLFVDRMLLRRIGFYGGLAAVLVFVCSVVFGFRQQGAVENRTGAIVTASSVSVKATPVNTAEEAFVIHEGTRVDIQDKTMKQWRHVRLADGREGWIMANQIEEI